MRTAGCCWWTRRSAPHATSWASWRQAIRGGYPLLIMAEDIEQEALATLVVNKLRGRCACMRPDLP